MANSAPPPPPPADDMAALKLYVDLVNSERQAIWARNAAMLVGNSFIINAIKSEPAGAGLNLFFSFMGFLLCIVWAIMTWSGWFWFYHSMLAARELRVPGSLNPFVNIPSLADRRNDTIFKCTMAVIIIFALMYVATLIHFYRIR